MLFLHKTEDGTAVASSLTVFQYPLVDALPVPWQSEAATREAASLPTHRSLGMRCTARWALWSFSSHTVGFPLLQVSGGSAGRSGDALSHLIEFGKQKLQWGLLP